MSKASSILTQLQNSLTSKIKVDEVEEMFGPGGFTSHYASYSDDEEQTDVPNTSSVDTPFTTNRPIKPPKGKKAGSNYVPFPATATGESAMLEAKKKKKDSDEDLEADADMAASAAEEDTEEATGESDEEVSLDDIEGGGDDMPAGGEAGAEMPADGEMGSADGGMDAAGGGDMAGMGDMGDMGTAGMPGQEEEQKTSGELGRIYELKKIYSRLTSIESYLANESSKELGEIRLNVSQAIELFEIVSSNFDSYKEKLDEIIVMYYKFIMEAYESVRDFYKREAAKNDGGI